MLSKTRELKTHSKILIMLIKKRVIMFEVMGDSAVRLLIQDMKTDSIASIINQNHEHIASFDSG